MQNFRPFVCGTDFSEGAEQALQLAVKFAIAVRTRIALVHVCELGVGTNDEPRLLRCHETLNEVIERHRGSGVELAGVLRTGTPWEKLDNVAADVGASLIVIGRRGAGGRNVAIGSNAECLLRSGSRPVLTVASEFNRLDVEAHESNRKSRKDK